MEDLAELTEVIGQWLKSDDEALVLNVGEGGLVVKEIDRSVLRKTEDIDLKVRIKRGGKNRAEARHQVRLRKRR